MLFAALIEFGSVILRSIGGTGSSRVGTYGGLKISTSTTSDFMGEVRSAFKVANENAAFGQVGISFESSHASLHACNIVVSLAWHAKRLISVPRLSISLPNIVLAWAVMKAKTTPDPVPTSRTNGAGDALIAILEFVGWPKRWDRKRISDSDESVSSKRNESSAGSYTRSVFM